MKSLKHCKSEKTHHLSDDQVPKQDQAEPISESIPSVEEALRAQFKLEDQMYQRFKLPLHDVMFDLCSK